MTAITPISVVDADASAHPAATSHAPAHRDGAASLAPLPHAGGVGGGQNSGGESHTIFSSRSQSAFLEHLSTNGNVRLACKAAGVSPQTAYRARRAQPAFAALWDAALLSARSHAEDMLAERALDGWEEAVFYHGEEVARRTRYSDRLLLAHLARLDRLEERAEVVDALSQLDETIAALGRGEDIESSPFVLRQAQHERGREEREFLHQDRVPCVPSCRTSPSSSSEAVGRTRTSSSSEAVGRTRTSSSNEAVGRTRTSSSSEAVGRTRTSSSSSRPQAAEGGRPEQDAVGRTKTPEPQPCEHCGGNCGDPGAELTGRDCMWLGNRLDRMDAARPRAAPQLHELGDAGMVEMLQLAAFEAGEDEWWLIGQGPTRECRS